MNFVMVPEGETMASLRGFNYVRGRVEPEVVFNKMQGIELD